MSVNLGLSSAYKNWVGTESVVYARKAPGGTTTTTVAHALRRALRRSEVQASQGLWTMQDLAWNLPEAELDLDTTPTEGDTITAGSEVWSVLEVQLLTKRSRWRFVCRKER